MRGLAAVLLSTSACYAPTYEAGTPCSVACPGDLVCIEQVCRDPGYVPPDADVDGAGDLDGDDDGHLDAVDNCPARANVDQHDEDGDGHGDVCDPCPHLAGTLADGDGDGVGDACDPEPAIARQVIRFFDPFTTDRPEWMHLNGVTRVGETLRISAAETFTRIAIPTGETRIVTAGTVVSIDPSPPHQLSIEFGADAERDEYHFVQLFDNGFVPGAVSINEKVNSSFPALASTPYGQDELPLGAFALQIDESVAKQEITLASTVGGKTMPVLSASTSAAPSLRTGIDITFYVRRVDFRFDYVLVIATEP